MYVCMYMKNMTNGKEYDHTSQKHKKIKKCENYNNRLGCRVKDVTNISKKVYD